MQFCIFLWQDRQIIAQDQVDFVFQPIFSKYGKIIGHEALMRPEGKNVLDFIDEMHRRSIVVLAEGVEIKEEYEHLKDLDVDFYQGYYLGRPA